MYICIIRIDTGPILSLARARATLFAEQKLLAFRERAPMMTGQIGGRRRAIYIATLQEKGLCNYRETERSLAGARLYVCVCVCTRLWLYICFRRVYYVQWRVSETHTYI